MTLLDFIITWYVIDMDSLMAKQYILASKEAHIPVFNCYILNIGDSKNKGNTVTRAGVHDKCFFF